MHRALRGPNASEEKTHNSLTFPLNVLTTTADKLLVTVSLKHPTKLLFLEAEHEPWRRSIRDP